MCFCACLGGHCLGSRLYTKSRKDVYIFIERQYDRLHIKNKSKGVVSLLVSSLTNGGREKSCTFFVLSLGLPLQICSPGSTLGKSG